MPECPSDSVYCEHVSWVNRVSADRNLTHEGVAHREIVFRERQRNKQGRQQGDDEDFEILLLGIREDFDSQRRYVVSEESARWDVVEVERLTGEERARMFRRVVLSVDRPNPINFVRQTMPYILCNA